MSCCELGEETGEHIRHDCIYHNNINIITECHYVFQYNWYCFIDVESWLKYQDKCVSSSL